MSNLIPLVKTKINRLWVIVAWCLVVILEVVKNTEFSGTEAIYVISQALIFFLVSLVAISFIDVKTGVKEIDKKSSPLKRASAKGPPQYFDFDYVKAHVVENYGSDAGILAIKYGSSATNPAIRTDEDWLIIVHGNYYTEESRRDALAVPALHDVSHSRSLDVQKRLFDGFLFGLIKGKPYEVSVAIDGVVEYSYQMHANYLLFLKMIAVGMRFETVEIRVELMCDMNMFASEFEADVFYGNPYDIVISSYNLVCAQLQILAVGEFDEYVTAAEVYPISKCDTLREFLRSKEECKIFDDIVGLFKDKENPPNKDEFILRVNTLTDELSNRIEKGAYDA